MKAWQLSILLVTVLLTACPAPAGAEWSHDPTENNPVCVWVGTEKDECVVVPDGAGGTFVVWVEDWTIEVDIYAQRLDSDGNPLWTANGIAVCDSAGTQHQVRAVPDGQGGVYISWTDHRRSTWDIYAQHLEADGNALWAEDGRKISVADGTQEYSNLAAVESGGVLIGWKDWRGSNPRIYVQRVASGGALQWAPSGVAASGDAGDYGGGPQVLSDGEGGAFLVWGWQNLLFDQGVRAQHVDPDGNLLWGLGGYDVSSTGVAPDAARDNDDGVFIGYHFDPLLGGEDVIVKRIVGDSLLVWYNNIAGSWGTDYSVQAIADGSGGVILAWKDASGDTLDLAAQRLDAGGNELWEDGGVPVCTYAGDVGGHQLASDGAGGAVIAWEDYRGYYRDIYAQRVDAAGIPQWTTDGVLVAGAGGNQSDLDIAAVGDGAVVIAWSDDRDGYADIYAQRVERNGYLGDPSPVITDAVDAPDDQGGEIVLGWTASYLDVWPEEIIQRYSVWRRLVDPARGGASYMPSGEELDADGPGALSRYGWTFVDNVLARYLDEYGYVVPSFGDSGEAGIIWTELMVLAEAEGLDEYWASDSVTAYSIDNLAPGAPVSLVAHEVQVDVGLEWSPSRPSDEDLSHYNIYRSDESGFEIGESTLVDATTDTFYTDIDPGRALWYYRVAAEDVHGNIGEPSNEAYADTWAGTDDEIPESFALRAARPNPFNPLTTIAYDVPEPGGHVSLEIYDVGGRLVRTLVSGDVEPGWRHTVWHGDNDSGGRVSSGVYFCRMSAEGYEESLKLTLLK